MGHDDKALPKPKSFGTLMPKKGPEPKSSAPPATPPGTPKQGNVFTVIGDKDTPPAQPARVPFPDDSMLAMQKVNETPSWQDTSSPGTYRGVTPDSRQPEIPETSFDNLPSDDWKLDDEDGTVAAGIDEPQAPYATPQDSGPSPFAPSDPASAENSSWSSDPTKAQSARNIFPDDSAHFEPSPFAAQSSAPDDGPLDPGQYATGEDAAGYKFGLDELEPPSTTLVPEEESEPPPRTAPDSKQFREACLASSTADSAMGNDNFKVAMPLFKKAYKLFKKAAATDSQEFGNCLHKLADCYYHDEDYKEALSHYDEFIGWSTQRSSRPDVLAVVVNLKRARTFQKLDRLDDCDQAFEETVLMANQALPVSHPMFSVVYNSFISMLQVNGGSQERLEQLQEQLSERMMTSSRTITIPQDLQEELSAWTDVEKADLEKAERNRQLRLSRHMFQNDRSRPGEIVHNIKHSSVWRTLAIVVVVLLLVGSLALMVFGAITLLDQSGDTKDGASSQSLVDPGLKDFVGVTYKSADGLKTMEVKKDGTVSMNFGNDTVSMPAKAGAPKEGLAEDVRHLMFGKNNYIVEQVGDGFRDPEGTILYPEDSKDLRIPKEMDRIADLANYYYSRHQSRYPKKRADFTEMGPDVRWENPLGQSMKPVIKAHEFEKYDGDVAFSESLDKFRKGKKYFEQDAKTGTPPGLIECMSILPFDIYHTEDGIAIMLRAYDSKGKFLTSSIPGETFVVCQKNGIKYIVVKPEDVKSPIKDSSKTTAYIKTLSGKVN